MHSRIFNQFLSLEAASAILLFLMAALAMLLANLPATSFAVQFTGVSLFIINDGLMTLFFLIVGLELKREIVNGQLSSPSRIALPAIAGIGGMIVPACFYFLINSNHPDALRGWATPVATDIAFALGVLSLFKRRVPHTLKLFLLTLAIFDDLGAIVIIAIFFSDKLSLYYLSTAAILMISLYIFNRRSVSSLIPYLTVGLLIWICLWQGGVHPTISGILLAFMIPDPISKTNPTDQCHTIKCQPVSVFGQARVTKFDHEP